LARPLVAGARLELQRAGAVVPARGAEAKRECTARVRDQGEVGGGQRLLGRAPGDDRLRAGGGGKRNGGAGDHSSQEQANVILHRCSLILRKVRGFGGSRRAKAFAHGEAGGELARRETGSALSPASRTAERDAA